MPEQRFRKRPVEITATRWWANGDHPDDHVGEKVTHPVSGEMYIRDEGAVVRRWCHPPVDPSTGNVSAAPDAVHMETMPHLAVPSPHDGPCSSVMADHGWIDTLEGGHVVCPGDWIVTGVRGERYPVKPGIFAETYEPVEVGTDG